MWLHASQLGFNRDRTVEKDLWGFCKSCYYADTCRAGCTWTSHVLLGKPGNIPYCHHRALELAKQGKRERIAQKTAPPGEPFDFGEFELILEDAPELAAQAEALAQPLPPGEM